MNHGGALHKLDCGFLRALRGSLLSRGAMRVGESERERTSDRADSVGAFSQLQRSRTPGAFENAPGLAPCPHEERKK